MAYEAGLHGHARKDARIANAIEFCGTLGGDEYDETRKYLDCTGIVPDWLAAKMRTRRGAETPWRKYIVTHRGAEHEVVAKSEAAAANQLRFNLYGTRPFDTLPPFSARPAEERTVDKITGGDGGAARAGRLSRSDIAARLHRMTH